MHSNGYAVLLASISAVLIAVGTVWRHRILRAGRAHGQANKTPLAALRYPAWWASLGLALAAYGFQAAALAFGSLLIVQPILVLSLMLTLMMSARAEHHRMSAAEAFWAVVLTACVAVVVLLGRPLPGTRPVPGWEWGVVIGVGIAVVLGACALAYRRSPTAQALTFGLTCGAIYGYLAVFAKVTVDILTTDGLTAMLLSWQLWAVVVCSILGVIVQQYAFGAGELTLSLPANKVAEPLVALLLGYTLLGEEFSVGSWGLVVMGASISGMLLAAAMLTFVTTKA